MPTLTPKELAMALLEKTKVSSPSSKKNNASVEKASITNAEGKDVEQNLGVSNPEKHQGDDMTAEDDREEELVPASNKKTGNTDTRAQELSPKPKQLHNKLSKHTKEIRRYPNRTGTVPTKKIPESQTNDNITKTRRKDKDSDEQDTNTEKESITKK
jgi:hypothetical protein